MSKPDPDTTTHEVVPGVVVTSDGRIGPGRRARHQSTWMELAKFLGDVGRLLWAVGRDPRVSWQAKVVAFGSLAYVLSPIDVIPDFIPGAGKLDDVFLLVRALRYLVNTAGYDILRELWDGSDDGFALLLVLAGVKR